MSNPVPPVVQLRSSQRGNLDSIPGESMWDLWWTKLYWDRIYFSVYVRCQLPLHHCAIFIHSFIRHPRDGQVTCPSHAATVHDVSFHTKNWRSSSVREVTRLRAGNSKNRIILKLYIPCISRAMFSVYFTNSSPSTHYMPVLRRISDMFQYKRAIFSENKIPGFKSQLHCYLRQEWKILNNSSASATGFQKLAFCSPWRRHACAETCRWYASNICI
jgi:hypothetical protein